APSPCLASAELDPLSLRDALPIGTLEIGRVARPAATLDAPPHERADDQQRERSDPQQPRVLLHRRPIEHEVAVALDQERLDLAVDRKSTRLNSSHVKISYAVFCLK